MEIVLFDLNEDAMQIYFECNRQKYSKQCVDEYIVRNCCIPNGAQIDSHLFEECGYSLNGILNEKYWSLHITPECEQSFVSFETNFEYQSYSDTIQRILSTFKPKRFCVAINKYGKHSFDAFEVPFFDGFVLTDHSLHSFSAFHDVKWFNYHKTTKPTFDFYKYLTLIFVFSLFFIFSLF